MLIIKQRILEQRQETSVLNNRDILQRLELEDGAAPTPVPVILRRFITRLETLATLLPSTAVTSVPRMLIQKKEIVDTWLQNFLLLLLTDPD